MIDSNKMQLVMEKLNLKQCVREFKFFEAILNEEQKLFSNMSRVVYLEGKHKEHNTTIQEQLDELNDKIASLKIIVDSLKVSLIERINGIKEQKSLNIRK